MRKLALSIGLLTLVVLVLALGISQAGQTDTKAEAGIKKLMESYRAAVGKQDLAGVMKSFADGPDIVVMGTGPGELYVGKESIENAYRAFFSNFQTEKNKITWMKSGVNGNAAWILGTSLITQNLKKGQNEFEMNWSAVLEKKGGEWKIVALHFSHLTGPAEQAPEAKGGKS
jgi:ketosteroid isomerase-like protein